jgi:hypothetical protein
MKIPMVRSDSETQRWLSFVGRSSDTLAASSRGLGRAATLPRAS